VNFTSRAVADLVGESPQELDREHGVAAEGKEVTVGGQATSERESDGGDAQPEDLPTLRYRDANAALDWLQRAFGFEEKEAHRDDEGVVHHAELRLDGGMVMVGEQRDGGHLGGHEPDPLASTLGIYVAIEDPDAHYAQAKAAQASIVRELVETEYGSREYSARDVEGNLWSFGTYDPYGG
jgi:uncharacterized glyoxalase superfamily protein PhnB